MYQAQKFLRDYPFPVIVEGLFCDAQELSDWVKQINEHTDSSLYEGIEGEYEFKFKFNDGSQIILFNRYQNIAQEGAYIKVIYYSEKNSIFDQNDLEYWLNELIEIDKAYVNFDEKMEEIDIIIQKILDREQRER